MVLLGRRAQGVINQINAAAAKLRHELLSEIPLTELQTCMRVLASIRARAEKSQRRQSIQRNPLAKHNGQIKQRNSIPTRRRFAAPGKGPK